MSIDILIATYNDGIYNLKDILLPMQDNITYKIAHQITNDKSYDDIDSIYTNRQDVVIQHFFDKGLSKNRNHLLDIADAQICLMMDDDISLVPNIADILEGAFKRHSDADIITFQTISGKRFKNYSDKAYRHTIKTLAQVSSIEIAFKLSSIRNKNIGFDESFGISAKYPMGEEFVFLAEAYKKGLIIAYEPQVIAAHDELSSGYSLSKDIIFARGAVYMRVFGWKSIVLYLFSTLKHFQRYKREYTPWRYFKVLLQGGLSYAKERKNA
jgi:glycosyltransferase involved in cell wall biosynthesis